jgi:hypothetical protein
MDRVLAAANASSAAPAAASKGGSGFDEKRQSPSIVKALVLLAVRHDRALAELADRSSYVLIIRSPEAKKALLDQREIWRKAKPKEAGVPHPCGFSQRVVLWARICQMLQDGLEGEAAAVTHKQCIACAELKAMEPDSVSHSVFRLRPKHDMPHKDDDRAWVWQIVVGITASQNFRDLLAYVSAFDCKFKGVVVAPAKTEDGPLVKELLKWLKAGGGGSKGRAAAGDPDLQGLFADCREEDKDEEGDDGMHGGAAKAASKRGRR